MTVTGTNYTTRAVYFQADDTQRAERVEAFGKVYKLDGYQTDYAVVVSQEYSLRTVADKIREM